jgi:uncharacterized membrane protein
VPDYSEFPTTPTAWQETQWEEARRESVQQLAKEAPPAPVRRGVDLVALVPGLFFSILAIVLMSGVDVPLGIFRDGGVLWLVLIAAGVALLRKELRKR